MVIRTTKVVTLESERDSHHKQPVVWKSAGTSFSLPSRGPELGHPLLQINATVKRVRVNQIWYLIAAQIQLPIATSYEQI